MGKSSIPKTSMNFTGRKFSFYDGFISIFGFGLLWLKSWEILKMFIGLTTTLVSIATFMYLTQFYELGEESPFWQIIVLAVIVFGSAMLLMGYVNGPHFYEKYIRNNERTVGVLMVLVWIVLLLQNDEIKAVALDNYQSILDEKPAFDAWLIDVFGSTKPIYFFVLIFASFIYSYRYQGLKDRFKHADVNSGADKEAFEHGRTWLRSFYLMVLAGLAYWIYTDVDNYPYLHEGITTWPKAIAAGILNYSTWLLVLTLFTVFAVSGILRSFFTYYPEGINKDSKVRAGSGLIRFLYRIITYSIFLLAILGFFKSSSVYSTVSGYVMTNLAKNVFNQTKSLAEEAVQKGDIVTAKEEYGYAAAAAGEAGDLDALENMLNELESLGN